MHFAGMMTSKVANVKETMARLGHKSVKAAGLSASVVQRSRDTEIAEALSELTTSA